MKSLTLLFHRPRVRTHTHPATELADIIRAVHPATLRSLHGLISHPRSLARPTGTWRPPRITIPCVTGYDAPHLVATVSRYRADRSTAVSVIAAGATRTPAYVVIVRISRPDGHAVARETAEAWVRALIPELSISAVHELTDESTPTYCWVIDGSYQPLPSSPRIVQPPKVAA